MKLISAVLVLIYSSFVHSQLDSNIIGEEFAALGEFPFMASIRIQNSHLCGGSIVTKKKILTAANCVLNLDMAVINVCVGSNMINEGECYEVSNITVHEEYSDLYKHNDLAVLTLEAPLTFNDNIRSINISKADPSDFDTVTAVGWGFNWGNPIVYTVYLKKISFLLFPHEICSYHWLSLQRSQFCLLRYDLHGVCGADSGGPILYKNELMGVISFGPPLCRHDLAPSAAVKLRDYSDWIKGNVNN